VYLGLSWGRLGSRSILCPWCCTAASPWFIASPQHVHGTFQLVISVLEANDVFDDLLQEAGCICPLCVWHKGAEGIQPFVYARPPALLGCLVPGSVLVALRGSSSCRIRRDAVSATDAAARGPQQVQDLLGMGLAPIDQLQQLRGQCGGRPRKPRLRRQARQSQLTAGWSQAGLGLGRQVWQEQPTQRREWKRHPA